jgi:hypothetical protein
MVYRMAVLGVLIGGAALAVEPTPTPKPTQRQATETEGVIDPKADAQLRRMSDYLTSLKTFKFDTSSVDEKITKDGQKIQELRESKMAVRRPDGFRVDRVGPLGNVVFRYDGKQYSVYLPDRKEYAIAPAKPNLNEAVDDVREKLHIDAPGGDLLVSTVYDDLTDGVITGHYIGKEPVNGVMAHHLAMTKKDVDYQIWIQDGPQPVPLRYVITSKDMPGAPQFTLEMRDWAPNAPLSADDFAFTPPAGAKRIEFAAPSKASH